MWGLAHITRHVIHRILTPRLLEKIINPDRL